MNDFMYECNGLAIEKWSSGEWVLPTYTIRYAGLLPNGTYWAYAVDERGGFPDRCFFVDIPFDFQGNLAELGGAVESKGDSKEEFAAYIRCWVPGFEFSEYDEEW